MTQPEPRVALVTGANHGIGAAVARALAADGAAVLLTYLRAIPEPGSATPRVGGVPLGASAPGLEWSPPAAAAPGARGGPGPGLPARYHQDRAADAAEVVAAIAAAGGRAEAVEADLLDPAVPAALFDRAEAELGPVSILVHNASGWLADTFTPATSDRFARALTPVSAAGFDQQFGVDARAGALLIAELARRHVARGATWGRIVALSSGGPDGFPQEVSYGAAKAALENYVMSAAAELAPHGITANTVHPPVTDTGWITPEVAAAVDRVVEPAEVAEFVAYLCSDRARLVSGNRLHLR